MVNRGEATRDSILEAAIEAIAADGLSASTALVAKRAGVAQGTVFNHFATKNALLNAVFLMLQAELDGAVLVDLSDCPDVREELRVIWRRWVAWGTTRPARRRALFVLNVSDVLTVESRQESKEQMARGVRTFLKAAENGELKGQPIEFIGFAAAALANATMDMMMLEPGSANSYREAGFEAMWNMLR